MPISQFCIQQRQKEQQQLRKLLIFGFVGSAVLHGILAYALPRWSFESAKQIEEPIKVVIIEKPKPEPKKLESKPLVEPKSKPKSKPLPKPEPVQAKTPPPPVKPPEPIQAQTPPSKPVPKEILTTPTPISSSPIVSAPVANTAQPPSFSSNFTSPSSSLTATESNNNPSVSGLAVALNSAPPRPETNSKNSESEAGISCVSNCEPEYPDALEGVEGSAGVKLTIDKDGNVIAVELADADDNSQVNRQALLAARQMQFSSPGEDGASVQVKIDFTVEGSEYDRLAREEQEKKEQAERKRKEQEAAARQQRLEAERQARQEQLERERQVRQQQLQSAPKSTPPAVDSKPAALPTLSPEELEAERLRKFRERIENY